MKKGRVVVVPLGIAAVCLAAVLLWPSAREPESQGKKLSEWLFLRQKFLSEDTARDAIHRIGPNALPWMLKWVRYKPSSSRLKFDRWTYTWPKGITNTRLVRWVRLDWSKELLV